MTLDVFTSAETALRIFMMNQKLWPDEYEACEHVLEIIERYKQ